MASLRNVTIHWKFLIFHSTVTFCNNSRCHRRDQFFIIFSLFHLYCGQTFFTTRFVINLQEVKILVFEWMRTIKWDYCYNDCPAGEDASFFLTIYFRRKIAYNFNLCLNSFLCLIEISTQVRLTPSLREERYCIQPLTNEATFHPLTQ